MERREIKFRGFSSDSNKWIYGYLNKPFDDVTQIIEKIPSNASQMSLVVNGSEGQFTGLFDKNGKEIYEGDIFYHTPYEGSYWTVDFNGSLVWCYWVSCFGVKVERDYYALNKLIETGFLNHIEIIGNIYEDSESILLYDEE